MFTLDRTVQELLKEQQSEAENLTFPISPLTSIISDLNPCLLMKSLFCYTPWKQRHILTATYLHSAEALCEDPSDSTPEELLMEGRPVYKGVVRAGDLLLLAPGSWSFSFAHGFQISERSTVCFKPWLEKFLSFSDPPSLPLQFCIMHYAMQAREALCSHLVSGKDAQIFQEVLKAQTMLLDGILKRIRALAHAVFHIESVSDTVFCRKEVIGRTCHECGEYTFLVSVHDRSTLCSEATDGGSSATGEGSATGGAGDLCFRVLCLDCALKRRPPSAGYNVAMPTWLSVSISREVVPNAVVTRIPNGVRSALPKMHLLKCNECVDLRWRFRHRLASIALPDVLRSIPQPSAEGPPSTAAPMLPNASQETTDRQGIDGAEGVLEFVSQEFQLRREVILTQELLAIKIPAAAPTERSFRLKLKQRQIQEALKDCLCSAVSSKKKRRCIEVSAEEIAAVRHELQGGSHSLKAESSLPTEMTPGTSQTALTDTPYLRGRTCLQVLHEMETKPSAVPVRYISVPTSGTKLRSDSVPIVVTPSFGMQIRPSTESLRLPASQSLAVQTSDDAVEKRESSEKPSQPEMIVIDSQVVLGTIRRVLTERKTHDSIKTQHASVFYVLACDVLRALMPAHDYQQRCQDLVVSVQRIFTSIQNFSKCVPFSVPLPASPQLAIVEGIEQVILNKNEALALYTTLFHNDRAISEKLKHFVSGIWEMSI